MWRHPQTSSSRYMCGKLCCMDKTTFMDEIYQTSKLDTNNRTNLHESMSNLFAWALLFQHHNIWHDLSPLSFELLHKFKFGCMVFCSLSHLIILYDLINSFLILHTRLNLFHPTTHHVICCIFNELIDQHEYIFTHVPMGEHIASHNLI